MTRILRQKYYGTNVPPMHRVVKRHTEDNKGKIVYPELSYDITGLCFNVHNKLGRFCREKQYADALEKELADSNVVYERERALCDIGKGVKGNVVDFLIENIILLDVKAKKFITKEDYYQMLRYLESSGLKLGLIVNFRNVHLKPKRVINLKKSDSY